MQNPMRPQRDPRRDWERRERWSLAAKMLDFLGVVLGIVCIFVLLALLFSLVSWLRQDISSTFSIIRTRFE